MARPSAGTALTWCRGRAMLLSKSAAPNRNGYINALTVCVRQEGNTALSNSFFPSSRLDLRMFELIEHVLFFFFFFGCFHLPTWACLLPWGAQSASLQQASALARATATGGPLSILPGPACFRSEPILQTKQVWREYVSDIHLFLIPSPPP